MTTIEKDTLLAFVRQEPYAVQASVSDDGMPPDITYWRLRPTWIRFSDFSLDPPHIVEITPNDFV